jgi:SOS-response transcriptional repressor LexA
MKPDFDRLLLAAKQLKGWTTQSEVAKGLTEAGFDVSDQKIGNWRTRGVSFEGAVECARIIGCDASWIKSGEGEMIGKTLPLSYVIEAAKTAEYTSNVQPAREVMGHVPLISWVQAGVWSEAVDIYDPGYAERWLPFIKQSTHVFALRVSGDSMTSRYGKSYPDGCIIFVDPEQRMPTNGDRVIARLDGSHDVTFKVFTQDAGRSWLRPLNDSHPPIYDKFSIVGKIIGKWEDE